MSKLNLRIRLVAILLSLAPAAFAGAALAQDDDPISVKVSYADLNLAQPAGRAVLKQRIANATSVVCGGEPASADLAQLSVYDRCRDTAKANAERQVASILAGTSYADSSVKVVLARR
jgi:UrcA family protein